MLIAKKQQACTAHFFIMIFNAIKFSIKLVSNTILTIHKLKKLKFDLASLILLTVLLALPFGLSNTLWEHFMLDYSAEMKDNKTIVLLFLTAAAAFLFLPIFFVTEALLSWCTLAIQTYRSTDRANP